MKIAELFAELGLEVNKESFEKGNELIEGVHHALEALAVFEGVKILGEWVQQTEEAAVGAKRLGEKLGISAQAVQQWGYAADVTGASAEDVQVGMQHLAKGLEEVATKGKGPAADAINRLGLRMGDAEFKSNSLDESLMHIADGFADMPDGAEKTALAIELFGRSGTSLIPMLNKGRDGLAELREEFVATGAQLDDETIEQFQKLEETQKKLKYDLIGLKNQAIAALLPSIQAMADGLMKWVAANREMIKQRIEQVVHALIIVFKALARVFDIVVQAMGAIADVVSLVVEAFNDLVGGASGLEDVLVGAALAVGGAWLLANLPLIAMLAAIAAIILVVQDLWSWMSGGDSVLKNLYEAFVQYLGESGVGRVILGVMHAIHAMIDAALEGFHKLQRAADYVADKAAFITLRNREEERLKEEEPEMSREERVAQAEKVAAYTLAANKRNEGTDDRHIESVLSGGAATPQARLDPWNQVPVAAGGPGSTTIAPTMHANITIQGVAGGANEIAGAVTKAISAFWEDNLRDASHALGARGGRLP